MSEESTRENINPKEESLIEERLSLRDIANTSLTNVQEIVRENLKGGKKPQIPEKIEEEIRNCVKDVVESEGDNILVSVLPQYRGKIIRQTEEILFNIAKELQRSNSLKNSFFSNPEKIKLISELLICNYDQIDFILSKRKFKKEHSKAQAIENSLKKDIIRLASYHNPQFLSEFINNDDFISQQLNISQEEARESFTRSMRVRFAVGNITNPIEALQRVKKHLEKTLTDENISKELEISQEEARELYQRNESSFRCRQHQRSNRRN